jgi:hypothetical protein
MHQRKPLDALELHDWTAIWARGDQELVRRANALLSACSDLIGVSTARMPADTARARIRRHVTGEQWTQEMLDSIQDARKVMAHAREQVLRAWR